MFKNMLKVGLQLKKLNMVKKKYTDKLIQSLIPTSNQNRNCEAQTDLFTSIGVNRF